MAKKKQKISSTVALRLKDIRDHFGLTRKNMATRMGIEPTTYYKNERGKSLPSSSSLRSLHSGLGISMDWLLFGSGSMLLSQKDTPVPRQDPAIQWVENTPDIKQLLDHMYREPRLRHEILVYYYKYMEEKGLTANSPAVES